VIYLASPYRHDDQGVMHARYVAVAKAYPRLVAEMGDMIYCPVVHGHALDIVSKSPMGDHYWLDHALSMLRRCVGLAILTLPGWERSEGIRMELDETTKIGMPVFYFAPKPEEYDELRVRNA